MSILLNNYFLFAQETNANQNFIVSKRMLTVDDGLPSRLIFDAIQDQNGFMWFATANGLCRYDGYAFKIYNTQNSPLFSNSITSVAIDAGNHLFIQSTLNFGTPFPINKIQVIDLNTYQFVPLNKILNSKLFNNEEFNQMFHDDSGTIYFLSCQRTKIWQYNINATCKLFKNFQFAAQFYSEFVSLCWV